MTSIPASRRARAMILAPRSCPSKPGLATTTRILRAVAVLIAGGRLALTLLRATMQAPMGNLVHGLRVRVARVVANAECEIAKREPFAISDEAEDHAELAVGWRQIGLEAGRQLRAVAIFGIAGARVLTSAPSHSNRLRVSRSTLAPARPLRIVSSAKAPSLKRTRA